MLCTAVGPAAAAALRAAPWRPCTCARCEDQRGGDVSVVLGRRTSPRSCRRRCWVPVGRGWPTPCRRRPPGARRTPRLCTRRRWVLHAWQKVWPRGSDGAGGLSRLCESTYIGPGSGANSLLRCTQPPSLLPGPPGQLHVQTCRHLLHRADYRQLHSFTTPWCRRLVGLGRFLPGRLTTQNQRAHAATSQTDMQNTSLAGSNGTPAAPRSHAAGPP